MEDKWARVAGWFLEEETKHPRMGLTGGREEGRDCTCLSLGIKLKTKPYCSPVSRSRCGGLPIRPGRGRGQ